MHAEGHVGWPEFQKTVFERSPLQEALVKALEVLLVEVHGTGTSLGDPIEAETDRGVSALQI